MTTTLAAEAPPPQMNLLLLEDRLTVARLDPTAAIPAWAEAHSSFISISRSRHELSIVCKEGVAPASVQQEGGWRVLQVEGPLDFGLVGILASITAPLARAGISIFAVSTYDTDFVMIKHDKIDAALDALRAAGHQVKLEG